MGTDWQRRLGELTVRKTRDALAARLPPYVTERDTHPNDARAIGNGWTRELFDGDFYQSPPGAVRPSCNLVFVRSRDGNTGARDPSTLGGGATDKHLIYEGLSRVAADAVLTGATTIRDSQLLLSVWHPELVRLRQSLGQPRHPIQIVATLQGVGLERSLLFNVPEVPVILMTVGPAMELMQNALDERPWIQAIVMEHASDLTMAFEQLTARGVRTVSCIGGRTLAARLLDAHLVQDVYLTTSPRTGGEPSTPLTPHPIDGTVVVRKHGTGTEQGVVFEHIVVGART